MSLSKFNKDVKNHSTLPDKPAITGAELKVIFDKAAVDIKEYLNTVLTEELDLALESKVSNKDGFELFSIEDKTKLDGIETGANRFMVSSGTTEPNENTEGDLYIQYID